MAKHGARALKANRRKAVGKRVGATGATGRRRGRITSTVASTSGKIRAAKKRKNRK